MSKVIEFMELGNKTLTYRYLSAQDRIHRTAKIVVRQGQSVVIMYNGHTADILGTGEYKFSKTSLPILFSLNPSFDPLGFIKGLDIYFINTTIYRNAGWGTSDPVIRRDPELDIVRLTGFGSFSFAITDVDKFINEIVGARLFGFVTSEVVNYITDIIAQTISSILSQNTYSILDMAKYYESIGSEIKNNVNARTLKFGVRVEEVIVESINTTYDVRKTMDDYTGANIAKRDMENYTKFMEMKAMNNAAVTPGNAIAVDYGQVDGKRISKIVNVD